MSGLPFDLASWALRGVGGGNNNNNNNDENEDDDNEENNEGESSSQQGGGSEAPLTAEEVRAQRLARMEQQQKRQAEKAAQETAQEAASSQATPMEVDAPSPSPPAVDNRKPPPPSAASASSSSSAKGPTPMEIDQNHNPNQDDENRQDQQQQKHLKKIKTTPTSSTSAADGNRKLQRKKELLLQKVLGVTLKGSTLPVQPSSLGSTLTTGGDSFSSSPSSLVTSLVTVDLGLGGGDDGTTPPDLTLQHVAEILATRLSMDPPAPAAGAAGNLRASVTGQLTLLQYLGQAHRKAAEELRTLQRGQPAQPAAAATSTTKDVIVEWLLEIQRQTVSYAVSCLMEPDLFLWAEHATFQLAHALIKSVTDISTSITFGVHGGPTQSFYYKLCEEWIQQDPQSTTLERTVTAVCEYYMHKLSKCDSVLETNIVLDGMTSSSNNATNHNSMTETCSATVLVSAWTSFCMHKRIAHMVASLQDFKFLLPAADTATASELIRPVAVTPGNLFQMLAAQQTPPYHRRSGPALEKHTVLGTVLHAGIPKNNPSFSHATILRQSMNAVETIHRQQRQLLKHHQDACHGFVMALIKAGAGARERVLIWISDALRVNRMADAMQPDPAKVSSPALLQNLTACLLRLCDPVLQDLAKHRFVDLRFLSAPDAHRNVFPSSGDDAVSRLGDYAVATSSSNMDNSSDPANNSSSETTTGGGAVASRLTPEEGNARYQPKNAFIPQCFFYCARALHFSLAPGLSFHERLLRQISHLHWTITHNNTHPGASAAELLQSDPQFAIWVSRQRSNETALFQEEYVQDALRFFNLMAKVMYEEKDDAVLATLPEHFVDDLCDVLMRIAKLRPDLLGNASLVLTDSSAKQQQQQPPQQLDFKWSFKLVVKLLSEKYAHMVRNYNLRGKLGDVLYEVFMPPSSSSSSSDDDRRKVPLSVSTDNMAGGQTYLISDREAQETLAPSLLLLYGEVEHTGYYDKMSHRAKISSLIKYLWDSKEHRPAFRRITEKKESFIKSANGIINETNTLIATVMQKLPEIRSAQEQMRNAELWSRLSEEEQKQITDRLEDNEQEVRHALPLCNKTIQMFGYLNTDPDIRQLFLLEELRNRLVEMLAHVLVKLVGSKGLDLKVENPESYQFRPKEMLRDLCAIFALFANSEVFQIQCARSQVNPKLLESAVKTCARLHLLKDESMTAFASLPDLVEQASTHVAQDEAFLQDAPDEFLDEILSTFMKDPVVLPSGHYVDRSTITQHLLNDPIDPFNREPMTLEDIKPATELKQRMDEWVAEKKQKQLQSDGGV